MLVTDGAHHAKRDRYRRATETKAAGESQPRRRTLTGLVASPRRSVCAGNAAFPLYRRPQRKVVMKRRMFVASFALGVLATLGLVGTAVAGELVPSKGSWKGPLPGVCLRRPSTSISPRGDRHATRAVCRGYPTRCGSPEWHRLVSLRGSQWRQVDRSLYRLSAPADPGSSISSKTDHHRGTGRFAGATGSFVCERLFDIAGGTTIGSFEGDDFHLRPPLPQRLTKRPVRP